MVLVCLVVESSTKAIHFHPKDAYSQAMLLLDTAQSSQDNAVVQLRAEKGAHGSSVVAKDVTSVEVKTLEEMKARGSPNPHLKCLPTL